MKKLLELEKIHELYPTAWLHGRYLFKDDIFDFYVGSDSENWTSEPGEIRGIDSQKFDLSCHFVQFFISFFLSLNSMKLHQFEIDPESGFQTPFFQNRGSIRMLTSDFWIYKY